MGSVCSVVNSLRELLEDGNLLLWGGPGVSGGPPGVVEPLGGGMPRSASSEGS